MSICRPIDEDTGHVEDFSPFMRFTGELTANGGTTLTATSSSNRHTSLAIGQDEAHFVFSASLTISGHPSREAPRLL